VLAAATPGAVDAIHALGARLVVIEPWPALPFRQRDCLSRARFAEQCAGRAAGKLASERALEASAAARHDLAVVDLDRVVCPRLPVCDAVIGGKVVRRDQDHLSLAFAASLSEALDRRLTAAGAFPAVSKNRSRLRIAVSAAHTRQQLERAVQVIAATTREEGISGR
jgi:hypothetical protein